MNKNGNAVLWVVLAVVGAVLALGGGVGLKYVLTPKQPAQEVSAPIPPAPAPQVAADETANWKVLRDEKLGFEFMYPTTYDSYGKSVDSFYASRDLVSLGLTRDLKKLTQPCKEGICSSFALIYVPDIKNVGNVSIRDWLFQNKDIIDPPNEFSSGYKEEVFDGHQVISYSSLVMGGEEDIIITSLNDSYFLIFRALYLDPMDELRSDLRKIFSTLKFI